MHILISGGPGAGCTSTAERIGLELNLPVFDSDAFFHKPTEPPFQKQYSPDERRRLLSEALASTPSWIVSGSIATWGLNLRPFQFGIFLDVPKEERVRRLTQRERERFGSRIDKDGDMHEDNMEFMHWAEGYETRTGVGRNRITDRNFIMERSDRQTEIKETLSLEGVTLEILKFIKA